MADYDSSTYGDRIAAVYDQFHFPVMRFTDATVEFLASVAGKRRVLELGIGTGRIALPLAAKGLKVFGIDASEKMVAQMRRKAGGDAIPVVIGNFADLKVSGQFSLIYVVFNTFFGLLTQDEQVRCFQRAAKHLTSDGVFLIEAFVPDPSRFVRGQRVDALDVEADHVQFEVTQHDPTHPVDTFRACEDDRERRSSVSCAAALRLSGRTRSDGPTRGAAATRALRWMESRAVRHRESVSRVSLRARSREACDHCEIFCPRALCAAEEKMGAQCLLTLVSRPEIEIEG